MTARKFFSVVSTQWLKGQMSSGIRNHRILDTSWALKKSGHEAYLNGHLPGALFFDLNRCVNPLPQLPRNLPSPACFTEYAQTLGINQDTSIILYDQGNMLPAAKAWWNFKAYGHEDVSVLEGGLAKWMSEGYETEAGPMVLPSKLGNFEVNVNTKYIRKYEDVQEIIKSKSHQIVDARNPDHFAGIGEEPANPTKSAYEGLNLAVLDRPRSKGHIPGAINLQEDNLMDKETKCLLPKETLKEVFHSAGVDLNKPIMSMCYNGNAACVIALAAAVCGQEDVTVYYGSWTEYGYRAKPDDIVSVTKGNTAAGG